MSRKRGLGSWILLLVLVLIAPGYFLLVDYSPAPDPQAYRLDLDAVRALASSLPGDKPREVRYEHVLDYEFSEAMVVAGDPWRGTLIPVYSYQLVYPRKTVIIDTAMDRSLAKPEFMVPFYDEAAYQRMSAALEHAALILITHEHVDHIGGIAHHPQPERLLPALRLNPQQRDNGRGMAPASLPEVLRSQVQLLGEQPLQAVAPGVVLVRAPGHTPGSQMIYVQRADGRELLFLGDVAWHRRSIALQRERPLFMTALIGEDRHQVLAQFSALHALAQQAPELHQIPGHDGEVIRELEAGGLLQTGFRP